MFKNKIPLSKYLSINILSLANDDLPSTFDFCAGVMWCGVGGRERQGMIKRKRKQKRGWENGRSSVQSGRRPARTDRAGIPGKANRREPTEREFQEQLADGNRPSGNSRKS